jgi:hypothetical protein
VVKVRQPAMPVLLISGRIRLSGEHPCWMVPYSGNGLCTTATGNRACWIFQMFGIRSGGQYWMVAVLFERRLGDRT